ncbi:MAG: hypothetical protein LCH37_14265 [Bacteroidetes bacterium]|nr:hypothetical protein [Bacteroidota bacterium]
MNPTSFNENEALQLIEQMINRAQQKMHDNGMYWLLWGVLVFVSALTDYVLLTQFTYEKHALVWAILMPLGGLISFLMGWKDSQKKKLEAKTYVDELMGYVVTAFTISLLIICLIMPMTGTNWKSFFPVIMVVYALVTYISGGILQVKPLRMGSFVNWICAIAAFFFQYDIQLLLLATAVLGGFIIPGILQNKAYRAAHV